MNRTLRTTQSWRGIATRGLFVSLIAPRAGVGAGDHIVSGFLLKPLMGATGAALVALALLAGIAGSAEANDGLETLPDVHGDRTVDEVGFFGPTVAHSEAMDAGVSVQGLDICIHLLIEWCPLNDDYGTPAATREKLLYTEEARRVLVNATDRTEIASDNVCIHMFLSDWCPLDSLEPSEEGQAADGVIDTDLDVAASADWTVVRTFQARHSWRTCASGWVMISGAIYI